MQSYSFLGDLKLQVDCATATLHLNGGLLTWRVLLCSFCYSFVIATVTRERVAQFTLQVSESAFTCAFSERADRQMEEYHHNQNDYRPT
eukprot:5386739-Amphidinium_carterae.1